MAAKDAANARSAAPRAATKPGSRLRILLLGVFLFLWMGAIAYRLVSLQIFQYGKFVQQAQRQQQRSIDVSPKRGIIYDRNGNELAMTIQVDSVFAVPSEIPDPATTSSLLAKVLKVEPREIQTRLTSSKSFAWVARKVDNATAARIKAMNLRGIYFQKESKRFYPKRELAAQVLGYVGMDDEGLAGIERAFDEKLRGKPGKMQISVDAKRRWFGRIEKPPAPGENLVLTLDEKIQYIAERELAAAMKETRSEAGTIIVQNPRTGEILALANAPSFNPNSLSVKDREALKNRAVSDIFEPGSAFKIVTVAAALEEKLTTPEELIDCQNGLIQIANVRIRDTKPMGVVPVEMVFAKSSNVGAIKLGMRLGEERLDRYIRAFGFGQQTGIEVPGETRGIAAPVSRWSKVSIGAKSMGQEIGVSAVQMVTAVSAIAHDGVSTAPRLIAGVTSSAPGPQTIVFQPAAPRRVVSPLTAAQMKKMMESVVLFGTGKRAILDGYTSAGKTGTAQKVDAVTGAYHRSKYIASFAGFAPVNKPAVSIAVILDSPVGLHQGGQVAAPVFARVAQQVLAYMNVEHDVEVRDTQRLLLRASARDEELSEGETDRVDSSFTQVAMAEATPAVPVEIPAQRPAAAVEPQFVNVAMAKQAAAKASVPVYVRQKDVAIPGPAPKLVELPKKGTVVVELGSGLVAPSLLGKSVRAALEAAQDAGVEIDVLGNGIARAQNPPPGARVPVGSRIAVQFSR